MIFDHHLCYHYSNSYWFSCFLSVYYSWMVHLFWVKDICRPYSIKQFIFKQRDWLIMPYKSTFLSFLSHQPLLQFRKRCVLGRGGEFQSMFLYNSDKVVKYWHFKKQTFVTLKTTVIVFQKYKNIKKNMYEDPINWKYHILPKYNFLVIKCLHVTSNR